MDYKYKLNPCPFCGEEIWSNYIEEMRPGWWFVACPGCEAGGPVMPTKEAAIAKWNKEDPEEDADE